MKYFEKRAISLLMKTCYLRLLLKYFEMGIGYTMEDVLFELMGKVF